MNPCPLVLETTILPLNYFPFTFNMTKFRMSKYLLELKNRTLLILLTWILSVFISYIYKEVLLYILIKPCLLYHNLETNFYFIYTNLMEVFNIYLKLILFASNQLTLIMIVIHFRTFIQPGLYYYENKIIKDIAKYIFIILTSFILLIYFKIIPYSWNFFTNVNTTTIFNLYFEAKLIEYLDFFISIYYVAIINSLIFIIFILYLKIHHSYIEKIKQNKKLFYFFIFLISTVITPPDINSLIILSIILISFLEIITLIIVISRYTYKEINLIKFKEANS